jgi:hypothetical protein
VEFNEVLKNTDDPFLVHLAHLFSARAHEQLGDRNLAARAYRQPRDPWRLYAHSSYRFWSQYMSALRREIWP